MDAKVIFLSQLVLSIPLFIVWFFAFFISIHNRYRYPQVARLTAIASLSLIVLQFMAAGTALMAYWENLALYTSIIRFSLSILSAIAWGLIIKAIFGWRRPKLPGSLFLNR